MLKVVSNTTPLIALSKISKLTLLKSLYLEIIIPGEVFAEFERGKGKPFYKNLMDLDWIKVVEVENRRAVNYIMDLDRGEAEAIVLAGEVNADLLILDELRGREFSRVNGLKITGTIGVLLKALENKLIDSVLPFAYELREKNIWISDPLINYIKEIEGLYTLKKTGR